MIPDSPLPRSPLAQKFDALCEQFTDFSEYLAELHGGLPVGDELSRAVLSSVARLTAFCEQMGVLLSMMREDVRLADELTTAPANATWTEHVEKLMYEWLRSARPAIPPLH